MRPISSTVRGSTQHSRMTIRQRKAQYGFLIYLAIALSLLTLERYESSAPAWMREVAGDGVAPMLSLFDQPIRAIQSGIERIVGVSDTYILNAELRSENQRLLQWQEAAAQLSHENIRLRALLKAPGRTVPTAAAVRVVGVGGGAFERNVMVNGGSSDGIERGWPAVDDIGLIGRVTELGVYSSRVLLVTDLNSRVPVRVERTGDLAISMGQNDDLLKLGFLPRDNDILVGDRILSSGHGGVYPPDLLVGIVVEIINEQAFIKPAGLLERLDYIKILAYRPVPPEAERVSGGGL